MPFLRHGIMPGVGQAAQGGCTAGAAQLDPQQNTSRQLSHAQHPVKHTHSITIISK
ncbi:MAG: hypothetical protein K1X74_13565 [Pirellulales bacterium]|nr:hypothetical protein [Pirellulales bacterium]